MLLQYSMFKVQINPNYAPIAFDKYGTNIAIDKYGTNID